MTSAVSPAPPWRSRLAPNAEVVVMYGGIALVAGMAFAGAFTHMHDWTVRALPTTPSWLAWGNAVISEIMPTSSYLSLRNRQRQAAAASARAGEDDADGHIPSTTLPAAVFYGSVVLSLGANLTPVTQRFPYDQYLLAALPAIALFFLAKMIFGDVEYARQERRRAELAAEQAAALAAEQTRLDAEQDAERTRRDAERAAEKARLDAEQAAERAAERDRLRRDHEAELAREAADREARREAELARVRAQADIRKAELEAADRAAERAARMELERIAAEREADARAEKLRAETGAQLEKLRAETARLAAETQAREQATAVLAAIPVGPSPTGRHRETPRETGRETPAAAAAAVRVRVPREQRAAAVAALLSGMPADATRDEAVTAVAAALGIGTRHARNFVPSDWVPGGPVGSAPGLQLVAG